MPMKLLDDRISALDLGLQQMIVMFIFFALFCELALEGVGLLVMFFCLTHLMKESNLLLATITNKTFPFKF